MTLLNLYILILIAPAIIFSLRILLIEISNLLSVSDYAKKLDWLKNLLRVISGSQLNQNEINEELVSILQMLSIMISAGESPMMAMKYVAQRSDGVIPNLIKQSFAKYESGRNIAQTMDFIAVATSSSQVRRLTNSIQIAIERGTPILDVLNNQVQFYRKLLETILYQHFL